MAWRFVKTAPSPDDEMMTAYWKGEVAKALKALPDRDLLVIVHRFGFVGREMKLREIGEMLGITSSRVMQIERRIIRELRFDIGTRQCRKILNHLHEMDN